MHDHWVHLVKVKDKIIADIKVVADVLQFLQKVRRVAPYLRNQNFHHSSHIIRTFAVSQRGHLNDIIHSRHAVFKIQVAKSNR